MDICLVSCLLVVLSTAVIYILLSTCLLLHLHKNVSNKLLFHLILLCRSLSLSFSSKYSWSAQKELHLWPSLLSFPAPVVLTVNWGGNSSSLFGVLWGLNIKSLGQNPLKKSLIKQEVLIFWFIILLANYSAQHKVRIHWYLHGHYFFIHVFVIQNCVFLHWISNINVFSQVLLVHVWFFLLTANLIEL